MRSMMAQRLVWGACFVAILIAPSDRSAAANCALYARAATGVALFGSAGGWWDEALGRYERGRVPAEGAILVFRRTRHNPSGHVAVVTKVVSAGEVLVDQANWRRGAVSHGMSVIDTSPGRDWTSVAVIDLPSGKYGRDYPTYGFVYPRPARGEVVETRDRAGLDYRIAYIRQSSDGSPPPGELRLAVATDDPWDSDSGTAAPRGKHHRHGVAAHPIHRSSKGHIHDHAAVRARPATHAGTVHSAGSPANAQIAAAHRRTHIVTTTEVAHHRG